jgi:hypothetical protein
MSMAKMRRLLFLVSFCEKPSESNFKISKEREFFAVYYFSVNLIGESWQELATLKGTCKGDE